MESMQEKYFFQKLFKKSKRAVSHKAALLHRMQYKGYSITIFLVIRSPLTTTE